MLPLVVWLLFACIVACAVLGIACAMASGPEPSPSVTDPSAVSAAESGHRALPSHDTFTDGPKK